jgi:hypothetical protein
MIGKHTRQGERIARVIAKDGLPAARDWARRTAGIYRAAVLEREPFAHAGACRRQFIESYLELKRFATDGKLLTEASAEMNPELSSRVNPGQTNPGMRAVSEERAD